MSPTNTNIANLIQDTVTSDTFHRMSMTYIRYVKYTATCGAMLGLGGALAYMRDCRNRGQREMKRIMHSKGIEDQDLLSEEELRRYTTSNFHDFSITSASVVTGATLGVIWPLVVIAAPLHYVFGSSYGSIIASILAIASASKSSPPLDARDREKDAEKEIEDSTQQL